MADDFDYASPGPKVLYDVPTTTMPAEIDRLTTRIAQLERENERLRTVLEFYANPETYCAIAFLPDHPCGEFIEDFSDDHGNGMLPGYRPGKRARDALNTHPHPGSAP